MSQSKPKSLKRASEAVGYVVTANHLLSGDAIYLLRADEWGDFVEQAALFATQEEATAIAEQLTIRQAHLLAGAYVIAMKDSRLPLSNREQIRSMGPTNYFHGKQQAISCADRTSYVA